MRTLIERAWDDLDHDTEATRLDTTLAWDGYEVTLDLSDANYKLIAETLAPWLKVGHKVRRHSKGYAGKGKYEAMRAWGDRNGLGDGIGYLKVGAGYSYRGVLKDAYAKQQASG